MTTAPPPPPPPPASRCWTLVGAEGTVDVEVTARDDETLSEVLPVLGRALGVPVTELWSGSTRLPVHLPLTDPACRHGAVLGSGRPPPRTSPAQMASALELHVVGGPEAGRVIPVGQGRHVLGRGAGSTVRLDDPDVSRRHLVVHVGGGAITVADLASTNGSLLDGQELGARPRAWHPGEVLRLGASAVALAGPGLPGVGLDGSTGGRQRIRPVARLGVPAPQVEVAFPRPPSPPARRRLAWAAVALPAVGGMLMAWLLTAPMFLFFAVLSPVVALGTWLSERWTGRRTGRREAAAHAAEVAAAWGRVESAVRAHVRAVEAAHPDLAALGAAARRRSRPLWARTREDPDALVVRLGSGPGATGVTRVLPEDGRVRVDAAHLPATVDLRAGGGLSVAGPRGRALGVVRAVVTQLAVLHAPGEVDLALLVDRERLADWSWARWLPHLPVGAVHVGAQRDEEALLRSIGGLVAHRRATGSSAGRSTTAAGPLVVVVDRPLPPRVSALLRGARDADVLVVTTAPSAEEQPVAVDALLRLTGETGDAGVLSRKDAPDQAGLVVDRLPGSTAAEVARELAALVPATSPVALPREVRMLDLPLPGIQPGADGRAVGRWPRGRDRLVAALGMTAEGPVLVDLCREGPHALVAGTTGSGKSELLQTLIAGLALNHPPDRCAFLLVDYKGGAAFAEAAALPHTVGLVTDLDGQSTARALRSLSAELSRRETILAEHQVADIAALPDTVDVGRLVIVVDEFATLAEELPAFVPGLVAIAQRGRSLGVHLVLATQRPSGVVSPEIRANCTLRISLRTTDEADSRDVLGTPMAAHLPVDRPGRAYLRTGSAEPLSFQVARVAVRADRHAADEPTVRRWAWPVVGTPAEPGRPDGDTDLARIVDAARTHAAGPGTRLPHRPWTPPLPDVVEAAALDDRRSGDPPGGRLRLGLLDRPDRQSQEPLEMDLAAGGTWLAVGGPRSGRTTFLRAVLAEAAHHLASDGLHVHVVGPGGELATEARRLPHTGTVVSGEDALRTVRLLDRLGQEVADRRARGGRADEPLLLLLVDGVEAVSSILDEADPGNGSAGLLRLARDGAAAGLTCVLTADRAVPGGRLASVARHRLVLPLPDRADYAVAGVPPRAVPGHRPPGRALVGEDAVECQLVLPRPPTGAARGGPGARGPSGPLRIAELPPDPRFALPEVEPLPPEGRSLPFPVGPGGDEGHALVPELFRTGGLLVAGPPGSGRTAVLTAVAAHAEALGVPVLRMGRTSWGVPGLLDPGDEQGATAWITRLDGRGAVVLADDVGAPADWPALSRLVPPVSGGPVALIAAATAGALSAHYQGPVAALRRNRSGLLLCPGPGDADLLGVRLPRTPLPVRPGSGWLVVGGVIQRVQVARRGDPTELADPA